MTLLLKIVYYIANSLKQYSQRLKNDIEANIKIQNIKMKIYII